MYMSTELLSNNVVYHDYDDIANDDMPDVDDTTSPIEDKKLWLTVHQFKTRLGVTDFEVKINPNPPHKLFISLADGRCFKVQQDIDSNKPVRFMYNNDAMFSEGCLVNVKDTSVAKTYCKF